VTEPRTASDLTQRLHLSPLVQLALTRWRGYYREPSTLFWVFGFPILLSIALGLAFRHQPPAPAEVGVLNGPRAAHVATQLTNGKTIRARVLASEEAYRALRTGKISLLLVPGSTENDSPTYRYDPQRPEARLARAVVDDRLQRQQGRKDVVSVNEQLVTEPGSRYIDFLLPGLLGANLMSGGLWGVGYALVEMRTRKLLKRLVATPMRRADLLLSFVTTRLLLLVFELPILLVFAWLVFDITVKGSLGTFVFVAALGSMSFAGLGLLVASRARNTQTVGGLMNLVSMPMYLLSGVFFASSQFPQWMQPVIAILPLTALNDALRAVLIDGTGLLSIAVPLLILGGWTLVSFVLAAKLFRWR
jgi:ABC-type multidrug transport system permease subunit